jgi:hypothetical protein
VASYERLVAVVSCASRVDAELQRGALEASGYHAVVLTDDAGGTHPELTALTCGAVRIAVPEHEADHARDLLDELHRGEHALVDHGQHEAIVQPAPPRHPMATLALVLVVTILAGRLGWSLWQSLG